MPDPRREAEEEAEAVSAFYRRLIERGVPEHVAQRIATGYTIARQRREPLEEWELGEGSR